MRMRVLHLRLRIFGSLIRFRLVVCACHIHIRFSIQYNTVDRQWEPDSGYRSILWVLARLQT